MPDAEHKLRELRERIDAVDAQLLELLNRRASLAREVARAKNVDESASAERADYYRPDREAEVLRRLVESNTGPLPNEAVAQLFREVMSACLAVQKVMRVAFLGPEGTFTEAAARKHFGHGVATVPLDTIDAVFREVESGESDYGVVPVENSIEGVVSHTLDMFTRSPLSICGEIQLRVHHCLLGKRDDPAAAQRVYSHQQSFAQCRKWLDTHLPKVERIPVNSNANAARRAARDPDSLAVAGVVAAEHYGLRVLATNIEDEPENTTRFLVIGTRAVSPTRSDKTSVLMAARNQPGALFRLLEPFARRGLDMTRIESRPSHNRLWDYVFFVDILGHAEDPEVAAALAELGQDAAVLKVLGSYPRAVP